MTLNQRTRFALTQLRREWRAGELGILVLALVVAISSHTAINHFTDRISRAMAISANDIIGGDLVLGSSRPVDDALLAGAAERNLKSASILRFSTVVSAGDEFLLVGVKATSDDYPLKGSLKVTDELYGIARAVGSGPDPGEAWVESRVFHALGLEPGDAFEIGDIQLTATRVLTFEPDRGGNFYSFTPRVMISDHDAGRAGIIQPGSRVWHRHMFAGDADAIADYRAWLEPQLVPGQRVRGLDDERPGIARALDKAQQYMGLASLVALLLAAVAIATSGRHYSERHYDTSALLRCMGCRQWDILAIYLIQLLLLAFIGGFLGNLLGWLAQEALLMAVADLLPDNVPAAAWAPAWSGMALSFIVLIGFTLPSILRLKSVPPQRVLRQDLTPLPASAWLMYGLSASLVVGMMWYYTGNLVLTLGMIAGTAAVLLAAALVVTLLFLLLERMLPGLPVKIRTGVRNFLRRRREAVAQTIAFGLTIMAMLVVVFIRTELVTTWQQTIPEDAPNHFVLNIQQDEGDAYLQYLDQHRFQTDGLYPVVRGRLTRMNDQPMIEHVSKEERNDESLRRELNLTWSDRLPDDNTLIAGEWWPDAEVEPLVSVEYELADRLGIEPGDRLTFFTGEQEWSATVASIRTVKWDNFKPNFYMIFNPGALDGLPTTLINSFYLDEADKDKLVGLVRQFPTITLLEMDALLNQVKSIMGQVMLAVEAILGFVLLAGLVVTLAAINATMSDRLREGALLRTLGAERSMLKRNQWSEFAGMGWIAGLIGVLGAELVNAILFNRVFELDYTPAWWAWLVVPLCTALLIGFAGVYNSRRVLERSPAESLRQL